ncbi:MAG: phytanoyl-CoA dioxygenase family protein [Burkholderiaceae bacterium]
MQSDQPVKPSLPRVSAAGFGNVEADMVRYRLEGTERALALGNRGPVRFVDGKIDPAILDAYWEHGFYIFQGVIGAAERADLERDIANLLDRAPITKGAEVDKFGRPALGVNCVGRSVTMVKPLSDLYGGTSKNNGRHPVAMSEPGVPDKAPAYVMQLLLGPLQHSEAHLRLYGHPDMLAVAEAVNGADFVPFNEAIWVKLPRLGGSVSWHQDGWTHWDSPDLDPGTHGFNFMAQLYGCDAANGLWVVPGTHRNGKADIRTMAKAAGSDRLPDAVPLICDPGDIAICNRQMVHGSFANTSPNIRVTLNFGFHRRKSVLNVRSGGVHNPVSLYDAGYIQRRSRLIAYGINARRERFPDEKPYTYEPLAQAMDQYPWSLDEKPDLHDYNLEDLGI